MKNTVKTINSWARPVRNAEFSAVSELFVVLFCTRFAWRDRKPYSGGPVDGQKSSSLKVFGLHVESV